MFQKISIPPWQKGFFLRPKSLPHPQTHTPLEIPIPCVERGEGPGEGGGESMDHIFWKCAVNQQPINSRGWQSMDVKVNLKMLNLFVYKTVTQSEH